MCVFVVCGVCGVCVNVEYMTLYVCIETILFLTHVSCRFGLFVPTLHFLRLFCVACFLHSFFPYHPPSSSLLPPPPSSLLPLLLPALLSPSLLSSSLLPPPPSPAALPCPPSLVLEVPITVAPSDYIPALKDQFLLNITVFAQEEKTDFSFVARDTFRSDVAAFRSALNLYEVK